MTTPAVGVSSDGITLIEVLASYDRSGFSAQLAATLDGQVRCFSCRHTVAPATVLLHSLLRLEGVSDPADLLAVTAVTCPQCQAKGVLVLNYGPVATAGDADVLLGLLDHRGDDVVPGSQAPSEVAVVCK